MKKVIIVVCILAALYSCKKNNSPKNTKKQESLTVKNDSIPKKPIKIYNIVFDSVYTNQTEKLTSLINSLDKSYREYTFINNEQSLKNEIKMYKLKQFQKTLAKDFDNDNFERTTQIDFSFLKKEQKDRFGGIRVEEWYFENEDTAESCFKSLINYEEREIHFKTINWIWVQQKNKMFLISTTDYTVDSEPMQSIKQHLVNILKKQGKYNLIEMD